MKQTEPSQLPVAAPASSEPTGQNVESGHLMSPATAPCEERDRPFVLAATIIASAMAFIDGTVVNIALPIIQADLNTGFSGLQWLVNAYALMLGSLILVGGGLGDRIGRRKLFVIGTGVFGAASIACAIAPNIEMLIAARAAKGIGAALLVPQSLAIIAATFPRAVRGKAIGIWSGASAITTAMGPAIGGFLIEWFDWRAIFWINIPLCALVIVLAIWRIPESKGEHAKGSLDLAGGITVIIGLGLFTLALTLYAEAHLAPGLVLAILLSGLVALFVFVRIEAKAKNPLMPLALFRDRVFSGINLMTFLLYFALAGVLFLIPFELIAYREMSSSQVGLVLLPFGLIIGLFSRFAGSYADTNGARLPLFAGSIVVASAMVLLALGLPSLVMGVISPVLIMAFGMAMVVAPLTSTVINAAPDDYSGAASGINNAAARISGLVAVAVLGTIASLIYLNMVGDGFGLVEADQLRFGSLPDLEGSERSLFLSAFRTAFAVAMLVAAASAILAAVIAWRVVPPIEKEVAQS